VNSAVKNIIFWVVMVVTALLIWAVVRSSTGERVSSYTFTQFVNQVDGGNVQEVTISGTDVTGVLKKDNQKFKTTIPSNYPYLYKDLLGKDVKVTVKSESSSSWMTWLANGLPLILLIGLWIFFMRQMQSGGNKALSFGKSRARLLSTQHKKITFKDVAGVQEAKEELQEIIDFLRAQTVQSRERHRGASRVGPDGVQGATPRLLVYAPEDLRRDAQVLLGLNLQGRMDVAGRCALIMSGSTSNITGPRRR
jgi:cell division protease FtsH